MALYPETPHIHHKNQQLAIFTLDHRAVIGGAVARFLAALKLPY